MILASIKCVVYAYLMFNLTFKSLEEKTKILKNKETLVIVFYFVLIAFTIWAICVAFKARKEINGEGRDKYFWESHI